MMANMRVVALIAARNERRFIGGCLDHLREQEVASYLIDNDSTDGTVEIAETFLDRGLIGIERHPHDGTYDWHGLLRRKEELATELEADWFIHLDPDEIRLPPPGYDTLVQALASVDRSGCNAVNFFEFTFVPTREEPDHDHPGFRRTMRAYYPFSPAHPHQLKAWKAAAAPRPDLVSTGGHRVDFPDLRMYPVDFPMRHYLFLSRSHAVEKYVHRAYDTEEVSSGWHGWRARLRQVEIALPAESDLRLATPGANLDPSEPRTRHCLDPAAVIR